MELTLNEQLNEVTEQLSKLDTNNRGDLPEISRLTTLQAELTKQAALEERVQIQEEKVESITLPYDFNEVFDDPRANEIVIEIIRDLQRQAYAEHNAEIEQMVTEHKAQAAESVKRLESLRTDYVLKSNDLDQAKERLQELSDENGHVVELLNETKLLLNDALSKRDAAVSKAEELEAQLAEKAKAATKVTNIDPSDRLAALVLESKNAKVKSAIDIALENPTPFRGKVITDPNAVAPLVAPEVKPFQPVNQAGDTGNQLVTGTIDNVPTNGQQAVTFPDTATDLSTVSTPVATGTSSEDGKGEKTLAEAFRRIEALENTVLMLAN